MNPQSFCPGTADARSPASSAGSAYHPTSRRPGDCRGRVQVRAISGGGDPMRRGRAGVSTPFQRFADVCGRLSVLTVGFRSLAAYHALTVGAPDPIHDRQGKQPDPSHLRFSSYSPSLMRERVRRKAMRRAEPQDTQNCEQINKLIAAPGPLVPALASISC
jgi:hypothetical protein